MFQNPIIFYSKYCKYSNDFLHLLTNNQTSLAQEFQYINIDVNPETKTRSEIFYTLKNLLSQQFSYNLKTVPTIIVENGEFILSGKEAFEWLKYKINTFQNSQTQIDEQNINQNNIINNEDPIGFNLHEMGSFSDSYSTFGLNTPDTCTDAKNQCFQFIDNSINTSNKSVRFNDFNESENNRYQHQSSNSKKSIKESELNSRYEEMIMQRKELDKTLNPIDRI